MKMTLTLSIAMLLVANSIARPYNEGNLMRAGVNMNDLHDSTMELIYKAEVINEKRKHGYNALYQYLGVDHDASYIVSAIQNSLYGVLDGMTFGGQATCKAGLTNIIYNVFDAYNNIQIYNPIYTMKFVLAINNLTTSGNTIFAYCNFDHVNDMLVKLTSFTDAAPYGSLLMRLTGMLVNDFWIDLNSITDGLSGENYHDVGLGLGKMFSIFIDSLF